MREVQLNQTEKPAEHIALMRKGLLSINLTKDVPNDLLDLIIKLSQPIQYEPNDKIISQGDYGDKFYVIVKGRCVVYKNNEKVN